MHNQDEPKKIRLVSHGGTSGDIHLTGFPREDLEKMLAAMTAGAYYVKVVKGELIAVPIWEELPKPTEDKEMLPFWRKPAEIIHPAIYDEYTLSNEKVYSSSISIQHLCGYNYSEEGYKGEAQKLESYGFECLRSRRDAGARFWEIWFLSGLWSAKGSLGTHLKKGKDDESKLKIALEFLRHNVVFGTLDVSSQRLAMASPE
jgi:hypothetical protein